MEGDWGEAKNLHRQIGPQRELRAPLAEICRPYRMSGNDKPGMTDDLVKPEEPTHSSASPVSSCADTIGIASARERFIGLGRTIK